MNEVHFSDRVKDLAIVLRLEEIKGNKGLTIAQAVGASRKMRLSIKKGKHVISIIKQYPIYFKLVKRRGEKPRVYLTAEGREFADAILKLETKLDTAYVQKKNPVSPLFIGANIIYASEKLGIKIARTHYYTIKVTYLDEEGKPTEEWKAKEIIGYIKCVDKEWKEEIQLPPRSMKEIINAPRIRTLFKVVIEDLKRAKKQSILLTKTIITILSLYPIIPVQIMDLGEARIIIWKGKQICTKCLTTNCIHTTRTKTIIKHII